MIGPGWLPGYRARHSLPTRRHTLAYMRSRRARSRSTNKQATRQQLSNTEIVIFDYGPSEFPVATAVPRAPRARAIAMAAALQRWLAARWLWLKPRAVPCAVAGLGMIAILAFSDYLANQHGKTIASKDARVVHIDIAPR